jgi:hypothetical protein|tara:strand:+ start:557 stop:679 length:123 start_codon:yes stop_codon:yes gene_type:complete
VVEGRHLEGREILGGGKEKTVRKGQRRIKNDFRRPAEGRR